MMQETLRRQREFFFCGTTLDIDWRLKQLRALRKTLRWSLRSPSAPAHFLRCVAARQHTVNISVMVNQTILIGY